MVAVVAAAGSTPRWEMDSRGDLRRARHLCATLACYRRCFVWADQDITVSVAALSVRGGPWACIPLDTSDALLYDE